MSADDKSQKITTISGGDSSAPSKAGDGINKNKDKQSVQVQPFCRYCWRPRRRAAALFYLAMHLRGILAKNAKKAAERTTTGSDPQQEKKDGIKEEVDYSELQGQENSNGHSEPYARKSNLKKTTKPDENKLKAARRKVSWPDAHGKDIAHVHEFEPSMSEEGELEGVRNSCICAIQ